MTLRFHLSWLPLFGAGLQIGWAETLDLTMVEAVNIADMIADTREREVKSAFKRG